MHIHWQSTTYEESDRKAILKEEIKVLSHANEINEHKHADILNQRIKLWHQSLLDMRTPIQNDYILQKSNQ